MLVELLDGMNLFPAPTGSVNRDEKQVAGNILQRSHTPAKGRRRCQPPMDKRCEESGTHVFELPVSTMRLNVCWSTVLLRTVVSRIVLGREEDEVRT